MRLKLFIALLLGAGLLACSDVYKISVQSAQININEDIPQDGHLDSMISPYRAEMDAKMNAVIAYAKNDFVAGRPGGALNNWAADAILNDFQKDPKAANLSEPVMCLLNVGGLRNPLSQGDITLGDIYRLMPFDNEVVLVEMPWETIDDITEYLVQKGGEPISGAHVEGDTLLFDGWTTRTQTYWVVTSDYLMNGGDKMNFFNEKTSSELSGRLMRDAMISEAERQDTLIFNNEIRMQW